MARIQALPLPARTLGSVSEIPYILVIDQASPDDDWSAFWPQRFVLPADGNVSDGCHGAPWLDLRAGDVLTLATDEVEIKSSLGAVGIIVTPNTLDVA